MTRLTSFAQNADSINRLAQDADFIRASLLTISPGNDMVTAFGHVAIRMECPSEQLDYCFTFEMKLHDDEHADFLLGKAKGGFMAVPSQVFLNQYRGQGRGIKSYPLNLLPVQEQQLWRLLDREVVAGAKWNYDFITTNCGSMCVWLIEQALGSERIVYNELPPVLEGTYSEVMSHISDSSPWMNLFFHVKYFSRKNDVGALRDKMAPDLLEEAWSHAVIVDTEGHSRPVFSGQSQVLLQQVIQPKPFSLTPMRTLILFILMITIITLIFKTKFMKKMFTSVVGKRLMLAVTMVLASVANVLAGGEDWYAYNVQIDAYPTGAGLVYVDENDMSAVVPAENAEFKQSINVQYTSKESLLNAFVKENEGWHFLGFAKDTVDEQNERHYVDSVAYNLDELFGYVQLSIEGDGSSHWDEKQQTMVSDDSAAVAAIMPLDPNNYFRALFTHAYAKVAPGYEYLAKIESSKLVNNIGDKVTFTAVPLSAFTTFVNWTKDGEPVSNDPTIEVTVSGIEEYVAHFKDSREVTLSFPAEGGYLPFFSIYSYGLTNTDVLGYSAEINADTDNTFLVDSLDGQGNRVSHLELSYTNFQTGGQSALLLYGFGDVTLIPNDTAEADSSSLDLLFQWSGESGQSVAELDLTQNKCYTWNQEKLCFNLIAEGTIAANSLYMMMPDSLMAEGQQAPQIIYVDAQSDPAGIAPVLKKAAAQRRAYTLSGRRVDAINREGIYVFDGKKVIYRKK